MYQKLSLQSKIRNVLGWQTVFLVIFLILFVTFVVLYSNAIATTCNNTSPSSKVVRQTTKLNPKETNADKTEKIESHDLSQLEKQAFQNFRLSKINYAHDFLGKRPVLTVVTRTFGKRKDLLERNIDLCSQMIDKDFEHVILEDTVGSGMLIAEAALYAFREQYLGDYICHLDDDNYVSNFSFVSEMKDVIANFSPKVLIYKVWHFGQSKVLPSPWMSYPAKGQITTSNLLVQKDVYKSNIQVICRETGGDYAFINNVLLTKDIAWIDSIFFCINSLELGIDAKTNRVSKPSEYVTANLKGGLGNQLFQIASAFAYGEMHNKKLICDTSIKELTGGTRRPTYFDSIFKWIHHHDTEKLYWNTYQEPAFNFTTIPHFFGNVRVDGYFQSEKYLEKSKLPFIELLNSSFQVVSEFAGVSLHVRRSDYVGNDVHMNQSQDYYVRAVNYLKSKMNVIALRLIVFSDDIAWCKIRLPEWFPDEQMEFVRSNEVEELFMMSKCQHHIIANSSFSWWGAFLDMKPNAITIAPQKWFNDDRIRWSDVYCKDWVVL